MYYPYTSYPLRHRPHTAASRCTTTMASDVYISPTCSTSSPRWLWDGPSPRRAAGTPVINITYDTSRWIYFYLRYLMGCIPPTTMLLLIISISSFYLPTTQCTSFLPVILKSSENHNPIHGTGRPGPGVVSIASDIHWPIFKK